MYGELTLLFNCAIMSASVQRCIMPHTVCMHSFFLTLKACTNAFICVVYYVAVMNEHADAMCASASGFGIPASSAEYERGFSLAKLIKSDWISRLRDTTVTDLMEIQLHSPDIMDFDLMPAIHLWKYKCKRKRSVCSNSDASNSVR